MTRLRPIILEGFPADQRRALVRRTALPDAAIRSSVSAIVTDVATRGDAAVRDNADRFGGGFRRIEQGELDQAVTSISPEIVRALERAAAAIRTFHVAQIPNDITISTVPGVDISRRWTPLRRVGSYVPGGRAPYPSTVLMTVVPARLAGVDEVVVVSPTSEDGSVDLNTLAACQLAGATEVWAMGGAQAIAALAYGTETVEPVQKIVGPGNKWVTAAKMEVFGACAIDLPAGPSEVLVLADHDADPRLVAADLLCQAEHGPDSPAILVTADPTLRERVERELETLLVDLDRSEILEQALRNHGAAVLAVDHEDAVRFTNEYAAEHVTILTSDPESDAKRITAAGSVYIGKFAPESAGDYATGANHVLPTGGLANACGPLSIEDFGSWRQEQRISAAGLASIVDVITTLADTEGLTAHRMAATIRTEGIGEGK